MKRFDKTLLVRIEKFDYQWLRAEAKKKRLSIAGLIRYYIQFFRTR